MANIDATFEKKVLDVPQGQWKSHIHHDHQPDHLWRRVEAAERAGQLGPRFTRHPQPLAAASLV